MPNVSPMQFGSDELRALKHNWMLFLIFGIAIAGLGMLAILMPFVAGVSAVMLMGVFMMVGGLVQIVGAFRVRGWGAFFLQLLIGVLYFVTGLLMIDEPVEALLLITVLVAAFLLVGGITRIVAALSHQFAGWGWLMAGGIIDVILGIMIWRRLPDAALWVVGLFVGITMIFNGMTWTMLALGIRDVPVGGSATRPPTATTPGSL